MSGHLLAGHNAQIRCGSFFFVQQGAHRMCFGIRTAKKIQLAIMSSLLHELDRLDHLHATTIHRDAAKIDIFRAFRFRLSNPQRLNFILKRKVLNNQRLVTWKLFCDVTCYRNNSSCKHPGKKYFQQPCKPCSWKTKRCRDPTFLANEIGVIFMDVVNNFAATDPEQPCNHDKFGVMKVNNAGFDSEYDGRCPDRAEEPSESRFCAGNPVRCDSFNWHAAKLTWMWCYKVHFVPRL